MKIAIIPARSGSKRIINKNIKNFHGKPIISYAIKCAKDSKLFDKILVSSDSKKIIKIAKKYGAEAPFIRPSFISRDKSLTIDVVKHAIKWLSKNGNKINFVCCIYPTSPLMIHQDLRNSFKIVKKKKIDFLIAVTKYSYPVQKSFYLKNNMIKLLQSSKHSTASQTLRETYHDAGQFYWARTKTWLKKKSILNNNSFAFKLPQLRVQDIDNINDWKIAEKLFKLKYK